MPKYTSSAEVATFLGLDTTNASISADLDSVLDLAEDLVDTYLGVSYENSAGLVLYEDGNGDGFLPLFQPLRVLTSVELVNIENQSIKTFESYEVKTGPTKPISGCYTYIELPNESFPKGIKNVKITGDFGFADLANTPKSFKIAVAYVVKALFDSRTKDTFVQHQRSEQQTIIYEKDYQIIPPLAKSILKAYKIIREDLRL